MESAGFLVDKETVESDEKSDDKNSDEEQNERARRYGAIVGIESQDGIIAQFVRLVLDGFIVVAVAESGGVTGRGALSSGFVEIDVGDRTVGKIAILDTQDAYFESSIIDRSNEEAFVNRAEEAFEVLQRIDRGILTLEVSHQDKA